MPIIRMLAVAAVSAATLSAPYPYTPLGMCRHAFDQLQWERTMNACTLVVSLPYSPRDKAFAYGARAEAQAETWSLQEALADADTALKLDPNVAAAHFARARAQNMFGRFDEAARDIAQAIQLQPRSPRYRLEQAAILVELGQSQKARAAIDAAILVDPSFSDGYLERAKFKQSQGDDKGALTDYAATVRFAPHNESGWLRFNIASMSAGDGALAVSAIDAAVQAHPTDLRLHAIRGKLLLDREDYSRAIGDFDLVLQSRPKWIDIKVARIYALTRRAYRDSNVADAQRAVNEGQEAVILCPHSCTYYALALAHRALGDLGVEPQNNYGAAVDAIERALRLVPHQLHYRVLKAQLLEARTSMREAVIAYKEALDAAHRAHDTVSSELVEAALHRAEQASARN